jgi:hypothetical protein
LSLMTIDSPTLRVRNSIVFPLAAARVEAEL